MKPTNAELEAVRRAIKAAGGARKVAAAVKPDPLSTQAVDAWKSNGVPPHHVILLEELSGVPRSKLKPKLYPDQ